MATRALHAQMAARDDACDANADERRARAREGREAGSQGRQQGDRQGEESTAAAASSSRGKSILIRALQLAAVVIANAAADPSPASAELSSIGDAASAGRRRCGHYGIAITASPPSLLACQPASLCLKGYWQ